SRLANLRSYLPANSSLGNRRSLWHVSATDSFETSATKADISSLYRGNRSSLLSTWPSSSSSTFTPFTETVHEPLSLSSFQMYIIGKPAIFALTSSSVIRSARYTGVHRDLSRKNSLITLVTTGSRRSVFMKPSFVLRCSFDQRDRLSLTNL